MRLVFSEHATFALGERGIERAWVERVVASPDMVEPDPRHGDRVRAFGAIPERDGRVLRVVYIPGQDEDRIVTVFFDRRRRRDADAVR